VLAPWWNFYNPNLIPSFGANYAFYRIKKWNLRYVPRINFNNSGEIMFVGVDNVSEVQNRGLTFTTVGGGSARLAAGSNIVISDIYGSSTGGFWGTGTDHTEAVKNWTGSNVKQKQPYDPLTVSMKADTTWKRNVIPPSCSPNYPIRYDVTEIVEVLPNTSGMMCMWGSMNDSYVSAANSFREIGDLYLDIVMEFKDLGALVNDGDVKYATPFQRRVDLAVQRALSGKTDGRSVDEQVVDPLNLDSHHEQKKNDKKAETIINVMKNKAQEQKKLDEKKGDAYESDDEQPLTSGPGSWHKVEGKLVQTPWNYKEPGNPLYKADGSILDLEDIHLTAPKKKSSSVKSDTSSQSGRKA